MSIRVNRTTLGESGVVLEIGPYRSGSSAPAGHKEILPPDYFDALLAWPGVRYAPKETGAPAEKTSAAPTDPVAQPGYFGDMLRGIFPDTAATPPTNPRPEATG